MGLFGIFLLSVGAFGIVCGSKCVAETAKCSEHWVKIEPHKNLMETEKELNSWCRQQNIFYKCLEDVLLEGKNGNLSYLPTNLLISKLFAQDLCTDGSTGRRRLLNNAACINQLNTEYCMLPEYLDIVTADADIPASRCSFSEKTFSCIAATMVLNCGFDAGRVYRTMLKITRYSEEVCDIEATEGIPPCEDRESNNPKRDEKLSEIYYGLLHRIGSIPEQEGEEAGSSVVSDEQNTYESTNVEAVTEAIQTALDSLDRDTISEEYNTHEPRDSVLQSSSTESPKKVRKQYKPYMKNPIITDVYRGILFYNYSSLEYAVYWRQPDFVIIENITCEHLQPSYSRGVIFRCKTEFRSHDPDCISNATVHEKVTPELIRDLDPEVPDDSITEFGPRPAWMKDLDDAYEEKRLRDQLKSTTPKSAEVTDIPDVYTTSSTLLHMAATVTQPKKPENWWEFQQNSIFPNDVHAELMELFMPEPEKYEPPPMNHVHLGHTYFAFIYDPLLTNAVENATCTRLDECHPRGRGLWKCRMWRRKIETCDVCYGGTGANILGLPVTYASPSKDKEPESQFKVLETTDPAEIAEGSGMITDVTPSEELITLVFNDYVKSEVETDGVGGGISEQEVEAESNETGYVNDETPDHEEQEDEGIAEELKYRLADGEELESDFRLLILKSILESDIDSEHTTQLVYAIDGIEAENNEESEVILPVDDKRELLNENVVVLQGMPDNLNEYTILRTSYDVDNTD